MKGKIMMAVVLVAVSVISALMLAGINAFSYDTIVKNKERKLKTAILAALDIPLTKNVDQQYGDRINAVDTPAGKVYLSGKGDDGLAAVSVSGSGFWGPIVLIVGIERSGYRLTGIEILQQEETPGLGARIEEDEFRDQFKGKRTDLPIRFAAKGDKPGENDVVAITGATLTSRFVETILKDKLKPYLEEMRRIEGG